MNMYDKISPIEKNMIESYIIENASRTDNTQIVSEISNLEHVLRFWSKNKSIFLQNLFGDKLIIEKEFECEKSEFDLVNDINTKMHSGLNVVWNFENNYIRLLDELRVEEKISDDVYYILRTLITPSRLASNRYVETPISVPLADGKIYKILPDQKISKILGKLSISYGIDSWEEYRILHSQILNEKTIKGTMCLSIHPLDFLTMSDNDCGWSSCMSWREKGDYRQGTVEMMNSEYVVMAYLKSTTDMVVYPGQWNSKRWRELFVVDSNVIAGIKGYPYWNRTIEKFALTWIKEIVEEKLGWKYLPNIFNFSAGRNVIEDDNENCIAELIMSTNCMYNDFYDNHNVYINPDFENGVEINYSGESECMICGCEEFFSGEEYAVSCMSCDHVRICDECGCFINEDENCYEVDGVVLCSYCYDEHTESCAICSDNHLYDNLHRVYLARNGKLYQGCYMNICEDCLNDNEFFTENQIHYHNEPRYYWTDRMTYLDADEINESTIHLFNINSADDLQHFHNTIQLENFIPDESAESQLQQTVRYNNDWKNSLH